MMKPSRTTVKATVLPRIIESVLGTGRFVFMVLAFLLFVSLLWAVSLIRHDS